MSVLFLRHMLIRAVICRLSGLSTVRRVQRAPVIRGYHGTSATHAAVILRDGFLPSDNDYDCLGTGVYSRKTAKHERWVWSGGGTVRGLPGPGREVPIPAQGQQRAGRRDWRGTRDQVRGEEGCESVQRAADGAPVVVETDG
jgi:hypothetical protein